MKKIKKLIFALALTLTMIVSNVLPIVGNTVIAEAATVKISKTTLSLEVGKTSTLKISGTKKKVTWTSSKKAIATVSQAGKVVAKAPGSTTVTAAVDGKKYSCKVTVKAINKYLKDAPFDAVEKKVGDISIVIPKGWEYETQKLTSNSYIAGFAPQSTNGSNINVTIEKTGMDAPDYNQLKAIYGEVLTQSLIQSQLEASLSTTDIKITDFASSDFTANLNTTYRTTYKATVVVNGVTVNMTQVFYNISINNYNIQVAVTETDDQIDMDAIGQFVLNSIVVTK